MGQNIFDRFGGWTGKTFTPTGFFRLEKDERWWLVTPEGNSFISFGGNHLSPDFFRQSFNSESWKSKLEINDLYGLEFKPALQKWFLRTCENLGFNTVGVHNDLSVINHEGARLPYIQNIEFVVIPHYSNEVKESDFIDVFSSGFASHCDSLASEISAQVKNDPFLIGYAMTDCPLLTEEDCRERPDTIGGAPRESRIGWPRRLRNLPENCAGKIAYVNTVREIYRDRIGDFNTTYTTSFDSFDSLKAAENWRPNTDLSNSNEMRDNTEFLKQVVGKYYETALGAIRKYDSNHMFIGDKLNANTDSLDTVLPVTSQYTDIIFIQMYGRYDIQCRGLDRWRDMSDKPFINGDSAFTMITENMPRPYGPVATDVIERSEWIEELFMNLIARPEVIGWHYCGLIDTPNLIAGKELRQHSGVYDTYGNPYTELTSSIKNLTRNLYRTSLDTRV